MKNTTLIKKYAFHNFKNEKTFEKWLQTQYHGHFLIGFEHYKKSLDCIAVKGILFTMEEYDNEGKYLVWGNKKKNVINNMATNQKITIPLSDLDLEELQAGQSFNWTFETDKGESIDVYLRKDTDEDY